MSAKIHDGKVDAIKVGGTILITAESVERFKKERNMQGLSSERTRKMAVLLATMTDKECLRTSHYNLVP